MATEPEIMKVSSDEFDKDPKRYRVQATPVISFKSLSRAGARPSLCPSRTLRATRRRSSFLVTPTTRRLLKTLLLKLARLRNENSVGASKKEIASDATRVAILFNPAKCWECTRCQGDRNCGTDDA
jgi:hypothetical protein